MSPVFSGKMRVLLALARLEKAWMYCWATDREAALLPFCAGEKPLSHYSF